MFVTMPLSLYTCMLLFGFYTCPLSNDRVLKQHFTTYACTYMYICILTGYHVDRHPEGVLDESLAGNLAEVKAHSHAIRLLQEPAMQEPV